MDDKAKHKFWPFHANSTITMSLLAMLLLGANCLPFKIEGFEEHGWPFPSWTTDPRLNIPYEIGFVSFGDMVFVLKPFAINLLIAFTIISVVGTIVEWLIRRREARKP